MAVLKIFKESFQKFYEHLFQLVFFSFLSFVILATLLFLVYMSLASDWLLPLLLPIIFTGPFFLSTLIVVDRLAVGEEPALFKEFFVGIKDYFARGLLAFLFSLGIYLLITYDFLFFTRQGGENRLFLILAVFFLYLFIFFSMFQLFFWGLLSIKRQEQLRVIIKEAFLLTLDNIFFALGFLFLLIVLTILIFISGIGLPLIYLGILGLLLTKGTRHILAKYAN